MVKREKKVTDGLHSVSMVFRGLLTKVLVFIGIPVAVGFIVIGIMLTNSVGKKITDMSNAELEVNAKLAASEIDSFFERYLNMAEDMSSSSQLEDFFNDAKPENSVENSVNFPGIMRTLNNLYNKDTENVYSVWVVDIDTSKLVQSGGYVSDDSYNVKDRPWYKQVVDTGKVIMTEPYEDYTTKDQIVSIVTPIYQNGTKEIIGVTGVDFTIGTINTYLSSYKLGESGYYVLVTEAGLIIYHPNAQYVNVAIEGSKLSDDIRQAILNKTEGSLDYISDGEEVHGFVTFVGDTGWVLTASMPINEFHNHIREVTSSMLLILSAVMAAVILLLIIVAKSIISPLKKLKGAASEIAQGNLDISIDINTKDETGHVAEALQETVDRLRSYIDYIQEITEVLESMAGGDMRINLKQEYIGSFAPIKTALFEISESLSESLYQIQVSAQQVDSGASQISTSAQSLASGSSEQASSIEELSATINEVSVKAINSAKNAEKARSYMEQAGKKVGQSNIRMDEMLRAMEEINNSSSEIQKIIKAIDDIAFQTNILALNAAVEAARAGSAGKGFAVVADEVRNLAARAAEAAKQTESLISASMESVNRGSSITKSTAEALKEAAELTEDVKGIILGFSADLQEQASAVNQITLGIEQISAVVQTTAATAEEGSASSEELSAQAALLNEEVGKFILADNSYGVVKENSYLNTGDSQMSYADDNPRIEKY